jgi:hypothetical protein
MKTKCSILKTKDGNEHVVSGDGSSFSEGDLIIAVDGDGRQATRMDVHGGSIGECIGGMFFRYDFTGFAKGRYRKIMHSTNLEFDGKTKFVVCEKVYPKFDEKWPV